MLYIQVIVNMTSFKRKKEFHFFGKLRNYFITGIVVLIPIGLTLYLTKFIIDISSKLLPKELILIFIYLLKYLV